MAQKNKDISSPVIRYKNPQKKSSLKERIRKKRWALWRIRRKRGSICGTL
jgi:hypothetical protein